MLKTQELGARHLYAIVCFDKRILFSSFVLAFFLVETACRKFFADKNLLAEIILAIVRISVATTMKQLNNYGGVFFQK